MNRLKLDIQRFASGSIGFSNGNMEGLINWSSSVVGSTPAQKAQNNKSNVSATIYVRRNDGYTTTGNFTGNVNIAGNVFGFDTYTGVNTGWVAVGSGSIQIGHNNNGTKTIYIGGTIVGPTQTTWEGKSTSGGQNVGLDTIQRMSSITSFDGLPDAQDRTNNVEGNFKVELTRYNDSFTDDLVIQYLDRTNTGDFVTLKTISNYESGDTFSFTNAELETLYASAPNENAVGLKVYLNTYSGQTLIGASSSQSKWVYIFDSNPTFSSFDFEDINSTTIALTGDETVNVNGYSNIQITIPVADKAVAKKGATMVDYVVTGLDEPIPYSSSQDVSATINNCSTGVYEVYARDSRGNTTLVTKLATSTISYTPIYLNLQNSSVVRTDNGTGDGATLTIRGTIWNGDFGDVNNSITSAVYRFKPTDSSGSYVTGTTDITPTINQDGTITFTGNIRSNAADYSWELDDSYNIQIEVADELSSYTIDLVLNSGKPNIALHKMGVSIGAPYDETLGGSLQVDGKSLLDLVYPVGAVYISATSTSPQTLFGGTWEQIKGRFLLSADDDEHWEYIAPEGGSYTFTESATIRYGADTRWRTKTVSAGTYTLNSSFFGGDPAVGTSKTTQILIKTTAGSTSGEYYHKLVIPEMPSHDHMQKVGANSGSWGIRADYNGDGHYEGYDQGRCGKEGQNAAHTNLPPYLAVYMWKRTA